MLVADSQGVADSTWCRRQTEAQLRDGLTRDEEKHANDAKPSTMHVAS
jgi:hypothetical protein